MTSKTGLVFGALATLATCPSALYAAPGMQVATLGSSPADMTAQWWQWAFSIPNVTASEDGASIHPLVGDDSTSGTPDVFESCGNGQHGDLWFLGGDFSGSGNPFERTCTIPFGKTIVLAVINAECSTAEENATVGDTLKQQADDLKQCAEEIGDALSGTAHLGPAGGELAEIKVERLSTVNAFQLWYSPFNVAGIVDATPNPSLSQADGQWVILRNLDPGLYRLEFTGVYIDPDTFQINGAYNIEIAEPNGDPPSG